MDELGAIGAIDLDPAQLTFEPHDPNAGTLQVRELVSVRLSSDLQERILPDVDVDLSAGWIRDETDLASGIMRFANGRATLIGDGGETLLLDAGFEELVLSEDGAGGLVGVARLDVDETVWANAFEMDYLGQIELQIAIANTGAVQEFALGFDGPTVMGMAAVLEPAAGDTNYDRIVDEDDYANLLSQFGRSPDLYSADFNGDDIVDLRDFVIMRGNFDPLIASPAPVAQSPTPTPEPATLAILALGALGLVRRRSASEPAIIST